MEQQSFCNISLSDPFFNSLKEDYPEFSKWYNTKKKDNAKAFIQKNNEGLLQAFLYLKQELEDITDVCPPMPAANRLKVGTFKIEAHNTKLGEQFVKKIVVAALHIDADEIYVTIYRKHEGLIRLLKRYGFLVYGTKGHEDEPEFVFVKSMKVYSGDLLYDYPYIHTSKVRKFILSIKPEYHTPLFPDSILDNEERDKSFLVRDIAYTNSIHKIYLCKMRNIDQLSRGDVLLIYRMKDEKGAAYYRSVVSSICIVEEIKKASDFKSTEEFIKYANAYSIFNENELRKWYTEYGMTLIKMTYNIAFDRRVTRGELIEQVGLSAGDYWGFMQINDEQFKNIISRGKINESLIID